MVKSKKKRSEKEKSEDYSGLFIPGGLFMGMGLGFVYNQLPAGIFIGLGIGFVLMGLSKMIRKK